MIKEFIFPIFAILKNETNKKDRHKVAKARRIIIAIELYRMSKVTLAKTKSINSVYRKMAWTSSPSHFWRFSSFARGQYPRTAPARKIQNLSHFLKIYQRVEIYNLTFSTR